MIERIAAVIIEGKELMLVTGYDGSRYFTPGGKKEAGETDEQCLARELMEELGVQLVSSELYLSTESVYPSGQPILIRFYRALIEGTAQPLQEVTAIKWYTREDVERQAVPLSEATARALIPQLLADELL
jgi:8-oxo-dGTP diphosphatase